MAPSDELELELEIELELVQSSKVIRVLWAAQGAAPLTGMPCHQFGCCFEIVALSGIEKDPANYRLVREGSGGTRGGPGRDGKSLTQRGLSAWRGERERETERKRGKKKMKKKKKPSRCDGQRTTCGVAVVGLVEPTETNLFLLR